MSGDVLIVIPCLNEERTIAPIIEQMLAEDPEGRCLIVVSDGGSTDLTHSIVRHYADAHPGRVALVNNRQRIQSAATNLAARSHGAGRKWLVRLDAHAVYPKNYVWGLIDAAERQGAASVVVPMHTEGHACLQRGVAAAQNSRLGTGGSPHRHPGVSKWVEHGHHALFRLDKFCEAGGYDETFTHNEDAEFDFRLSKVGGRIWLAGDLSITYFPRQTLRSLFQQYLAYGRGRARTVLRHKTGLRVRQALPLLVPPALVLALLGPLEPLAVLPAAIWLSTCLAFGAVAGLRRRSLCEASAGPALVVMHFAWAAGFLGQVFTPKGGLPQPEPILHPTASLTPEV